MNHADIAAIIVSHQSAETIDECLRRLRGAEGVGAIRVIDNGSNDGTMDPVQRHAARDPRVHFIANPDNPGFGVACNQGAADLPRADGMRWLAFVNPDCLVEAGTLARLRAHATASGREVVLGADLLDEAGSRDAAARRRDPDFAGMLRTMVAALVGSGKPPSRGVTQLGVPIEEGTTLQPVEAVSGALMLVSRDLFERLDGFDPGYRLHAEDLDLCRRAREAGALVAVANDVSVVHIRGVSSRSRPLFVEWHKHRGLWRYFRKFEAERRGGFTRAAVFAAIWLRFPIAVLRAMTRLAQ